MGAVPQLLALHEANPAGLQPIYFVVSLSFHTPVESTTTFESSISYY